MLGWLEAIFELLKIAVPALIVYFTASGLLRNHLRTQEKMELLRNQAARAAETLPLRLQAYERVSLFCERISIPSLLLRLQQPDQTAGELRLSIYLAIQHEYEHNMSQQIYMSQSLWSIVQQARDNTLQAVSSVSDIVEPQMPARRLARTLLDQAAPSSAAGLGMALSAVKKEASLLFG